MDTPNYLIKIINAVVLRFYNTYIDTLCTFHD